LTKLSSISAQETFNPKIVKAQSLAFEQAWQALKSGGITFEDGTVAASTKTILATSIIRHSKSGERDPRQLCTAALIDWACESRRNHTKTA
jgi:hypothetical protein